MSWASETVYYAVLLVLEETFTLNKTTLDLGVESVKVCLKEALFVQVHVMTFLGSMKCRFQARVLV